MKKTLFLLIPLILGILACRASSQSTPTPDVNAIVEKTLTAIAEITPEPTPITLSTDSLRSCLYRSPDWGEFQLTDGVYYRQPQTAQESPETYTTRLLDPILFGDINADGQEDAVVFLATQNGGTGHFVEMAAMLNQNGKPENVSTISLGDRIIVKGGTIQNGVIRLDLLVHGPNDGLCCPSQAVTWNFQLVDGKLVQIP